MAEFSLGKSRVFNGLTREMLRRVGTPVTVDAHPWLQGPLGNGSPIGSEFFRKRALANRDRFVINPPASGLLVDFSELQHNGFDPRQVDKEIIDFYENTAAYDLNLRSRWFNRFGSAGRVINTLYSKGVQQMYLPSASEENTSGIGSEIQQIVDSQSGAVKETVWTRIMPDGSVLFTGAYSVAEMPSGKPAVKVVFPLPHGNTSVFLEAENGKDGSLLLTSSGKRFGDTGTYLVAGDEADPQNISARYFRGFNQKIHVIKPSDEPNALRTVHQFALAGRRVLQLTYDINHRQSTDYADAGTTLALP